MDAWLLIGVILFIIKNPHRRFLFLVSFFAVGLIGSEILWFLPVGNVIPEVAWILSLIGFIVSYGLRFYDKDHYHPIDYLKLPALITLVIYPSPFYFLSGIEEGVFWSVMRSMTFCFIGVIFMYDRVILKPETMKRKYIVVIVVQSVLILLTLMYAFVQQAEATKQRQIAEEQANVAYKLQLELQKNK